MELKWFQQHLLEDILPHWLQHAVTETGCFLPRFDRQWNPLGQDYATLVSQSRLLYNFCIGYELTQDDDYLQAVEKGLRFLLGNFWDNQYGGWFSTCRCDGQVLDSQKDTYGHAFAIFGLAHAARITGNPDPQHAASETVEILKENFQDDHGGFKLSLTRDFQEAGKTKSQNPLMHLFEALLALGDMSGEQAVYDEAEQVADFVLTKLVRASDHRLPELYNAHWQELPADDGGRIDIGHAFEWAYLLSLAVARGLPEHYLTHAESFIEYGLKLGYDAAAGGIFSPASPDGLTISGEKGWWQQCEATRALLRFAVRGGREELRRPLRKTVDFVKQSFIDQEYGGWYTSLTSQNKGSEWKVDYHVVGMCLEAIQCLELRHA